MRTALTVAALSVAALPALLLGGWLLVESTTPPVPLSPARELADPDSRFGRFAGLDVHHKVAGDPDDPTVLLFHHFHGNVATWRHVLTGLADDHHVAAFDRPGFGLSERPVPNGRGPEDPYARATSVRIALELLDDLDAPQAVLVGSSAGGTVALETYAVAPERVRALILLSPAITGDVGPPEQFRPLLRAAPVRLLAPRLIERLAGELTLERVTRSWHDPSSATPDNVDAYARPLRVEGWQQGYLGVLSADEPPDLRHLLPRIDVPTLVVSGASDRIISPSWNQRTAAAIPNARFEVLPACGHTPQEECPEQLLELVRGFLAEL
jgi:pimeloyl-ACP methyl ester carboxylesterase